MSVLSLPRIYFTGSMCWDPRPENNNDYFPTYDDEQAALNWAFSPAVRHQHHAGQLPDHVPALGDRQSDDQLPQQQNL